MASRMGLVWGEEEAVFPTAEACHAYPTADNIKAGFGMAGIFPLSREAVDTTQVG